ncbi:MAG: HAMP domain-containing sensor histidine kinase [candidate division WOR-3 bacterium]
MLRNFALRIVIIYIIIAGLYITFSDRIILRFVSDMNSLTKAQTYKGWGYVVVTGILLYILIKNQLERLKETDALLKKAEELNERLSRINRELKELDARRSMFITSIGHELRHPLNLIIGFTDILLKEYSGKINEEQRRQLQIIKDSSGHLISLINEIIDITKIELTKERMGSKQFDLEKLVLETVDSYRPLARQKNLKIDVNSPGRVEIVSDENRLRQVLVNLLSNSIKFTNAGEIKVELIDGVDFVNLIVQDTGVGINNEEMKYLFEPFNIVKFKNRPDVEGTGLGLYITKRIINLLKGEVSVESQLNRGSKFIISLPKGYETK